MVILRPSKGKMNIHRLLKIGFVTTALTLGSFASIPMSEAVAQSVQLQAQASEIYAGMPFQLSVVVSDFDESPQPTIDEFTIQDADVQLLGVSPRVSSMTTIINGRRSSRKEVTFVFNYQITPKREGVYMLPVIVARQGAREASSEQRVTFTAQNVQTTADMKLELQIPERKFWVGETFELKVAWFLRKDVSSQVFNLPFLQMPDTFDVEEPVQVHQGWAIPLNVGSRQLSFPYTRDSVLVNGLEYTRFTISIRLTPLKSGVIPLEPAKVLAELENGTKRDVWGFAQNSYKLYRAEDIARTIDVRELPQTSRPATFSNAMGSDYAISVTADRTIVKAGDPIVLTIDISSSSSLDGLILPSLLSAGLNEQLFGVSNEDPIGENITGAQKRNIKRFVVPVRIKSDRVTEIPPLAFSYFNPTTEEFSTVHSQPIALSVTAVDKIGAGDVYIGKKNPPSVPQNSGDAGTSDTAGTRAQAPAESGVGALDMGLMIPADGLSLPMDNAVKRALRLSLYIVPLLLWGAIAVIRRIRRRRADVSEQRHAAEALRDALASAPKQSAREAASHITNALNAYLTATESPRDPFLNLCERMDVEAYRPDASQPLSPELIADWRKTLSAHTNPKYARLAQSLFAIVMTVLIALPGLAQAESTPDALRAGFDSAVETYHKALATSERAERIARFKQASSQFEALAQDAPDVVEFYVNAGNAALGAVDYGRAVLNYRRALRIEPANAQARSNLASIQAMQGEPVQNDTKILSSAFFLNETVSRDGRLMIAAICFAFGVLLLIPWRGRQSRTAAYFAILPFILWIWAILSVVLDAPREHAVVMTETFLKTADNPGASNVSSTPLEPGYSVKIVDAREHWVQVQLVNAQQGWIPESTIERIDP